MGRGDFGGCSSSVRYVPMRFATNGNGKGVLEVEMARMNYFTIVSGVCWDERLGLRVEVEVESRME